MFGSFVLLRALDAVVATAAAEERAEAFTVPLEAVVALETGSIAAVGAGAVGATIVSRPGTSESFGCSAEKSSARQLISIHHINGATEGGLHKPLDTAREICRICVQEHMQTTLERRFGHWVHTSLPPIERSCRHRSS